MPAYPPWAVYYCSTLQLPKPGPQSDPGHLLEMFLRHFTQGRHYAKTKCNQGTKSKFKGKYYIYNHQLVIDRNDDSYQSSFMYFNFCYRGKWIFCPYSKN